MAGVSITAASLPVLGGAGLSGPAGINGDRALSAAERRAYMEYHAGRNAELTAASRGVVTLAACRSRVAVAPGSTPARVAMLQFFDWASAALAPHFAGRAVTVVDIGCGTGRQLDPFIAHGYRGLYVGIDVARHAKWVDGASGGFERRLVVADVNAIDPAILPPIDLLISATALEHIRDDAGAVSLLTSRMAPGSVQVHFVPGEAALPLYGPHGWRQYSPACLSAMFPGAEIYRFGGVFTNRLHRRWVTPATQGRGTLKERWPRPYGLLRAMASGLDRLAGNRPASMYGVIQRTAPGARAAA